MQAWGGHQTDFQAGVKFFVQRRERGDWPLNCCEARRGFVPRRGGKVVERALGQVTWIFLIQSKVPIWHNFKRYFWGENCTVILRLNDIFQFGMIIAAFFKEEKESLWRGLLLSDFARQMGEFLRQVTSCNFPRTRRSAWRAATCSI